MKVREYVDAEYCSNALSLESVAAYVHKTPAYISRVFKMSWAAISATI